jgi:hypothetical protein
MMVRLEVLIDEVELTMLGVPTLPWERASGAGDIELPGGRMRQSREASFDRHRPSMTLNE